MAKPKGSTKIGGRIKGTPNKITRQVRELVLEVFNTIQDHPTANLQSFAEANPKDFYAIASKLIPTDVNAKVNATEIKVIRE